MARKRYTDDFRASAVIMLESQGYPQEKGALTTVANHLRVPLSTLRGWFMSEHNPPPTEVRNIKKQEIVEIIRAEIYAALEAAPNQRDIASYKDLITGAAILVDKLQLLTGEPTERHEYDHTISHSARVEELTSIFDAARSRTGALPDHDGDANMVVH